MSALIGIISIAKFDLKSHLIGVFQKPLNLQNPLFLSFCLAWMGYNSIFVCDFDDVCSQATLLVSVYPTHPNQVSFFENK